MALTKRRQLFVAEYVRDPKANATQAAIAAGFNTKRAKITGCELLKDPEVRLAIERQTTRRLDGLNKPLTREAVLEYIITTIERAIDSGSGAWQGTVILKGAELLGRHLGMFTDKLEIGLDAKLMERIEAARRRVGLPPAFEQALPEQASPEDSPTLPQ